MKRVHGLGALALAFLWTGCAASDDQAAEGGAIASISSADRLNPVIALHEADQPVFGLYAPSPGGGRGRGGAAPPPVKEPGVRAAETLAYGMSDYVFDGSMERGVEGAMPAFTAFADALHEAGANARTNPFIVKMAKISDQAQATRDVALELDAGVSGVMFVEVETAEEAQMGLDAMRYESQGGTRPDGVGNAPLYWGVSEEEYRTKADLWPLNPEGELISWVIVESHEGLANVREIAAVPGIGVLWPGAGTLRGLFSTTDADGNRTLDEEAWENAIQQVLSACKEFDVPCGFPSNASDIEMRMEQGFSVFVMGWGESGFETVEMGRSLAGR
jgi:2-keto-3-deoxy-L-rhamnonate aldolase RhmA